MRTKTLLAALAAIALGVASLQAQTVYSKNVVGYANVVALNAVTYSMSIPFAVGSSNGANEIWPLVGGQPTIPDFSTLLIWNGGGYDAYLSDSTSPSLWDDSGASPIPNSPLLPVGKGFFLIPSATYTNTWVGAVAVDVGTSNKMTLLNAVTYLVSPVVPYAGSITNGNPATGAGGPGLSSNNGMPDFSTLLIWNGSGYDAYLSDSTSGSLWDDSGASPIPFAPNINVGQSFFIIPAADWSWTVGL